MFKSDLKEKYPFLTEYFQQGLSNPLRAISHSILLYGQDISAQYELAKEIARLLNCKESKNENCNCLNCNWVRNNEHPAVLTVSKIDSKPSDDESKTVISVAQAKMIKNSLLNTSDYHRVFIFCDAEIRDGVWTPSGLNEDNFHAETANSLLKTIEEPPENTTFFFLTKDKNDLIETIISRSQSFYVPSYSKNEEDYSLIESHFENYPQLERMESFDLAQNLFLLTKEQGSEKVLNQIQTFLTSLLKSNLENTLLKSKVISDIKHVKEAKQMVKNHVNPQLAIENMCLKFTE